jgi:hypothetical protein
MRARNSFMTSLPIIRSSHEAQAFIINPVANARVYPTSGLIRGTEIDVTTTSSSSSSFEIGVSSSSTTKQNVNYSQVLDKTNLMSETSILFDDADNNIVEVLSADSYRRGLVTIGFITMLFASNSPVLHSSFSMTTNTPPVLLINSAVSMVGLIGVVVASPLLSRFVPDPSINKTNDNRS